MEDIVLPDTSLCAIVRDEVINPGGGVLRFLRSVMPHVEEGVVVDTGSIDGTRELLEEAKKEFPHLSVYDLTFTGYAPARNYSLSRVSTTHALILDADEIILQDRYVGLKGLLDFYRNNCTFDLPKVFSFGFTEVRSDGEHEGQGHRHRLFDKSVGCFQDGLIWRAENLDINDSYEIPLQEDVYHFLPPTESVSLKRREWYTRDIPSLAPSTHSSFTLWKQFNPLRDRYKASNLDCANLVAV